MMEFVSGKDYPIYEMENKKCLETTNQIIFRWILLVGSIPTPLQKIKSVGIMTFPIYGRVRFMFQTTNQIMMKNMMNRLYIYIYFPLIYFSLTPTSFIRVVEPVSQTTRSWSLPHVGASHATRCLSHSSPAEPAPRKMLIWPVLPWWTLWLIQQKTAWWFQPTPLKNHGLRQLG